MAITFLQAVERGEATSPVPLADKNETSASSGVRGHVLSNVSSGKSPLAFGIQVVVAHDYG